MLRLLISWVLFAAVFLGLSKVLPGFRVRNFGTALAVSAVYSVLQIVVHFVLFRTLWILTIVPVVLTFGLIYFMVNAAILWLTDKLIDDFEVDGIVTGLVAAVILTIVNNVIRLALLG